MGTIYLLRDIRFKEQGKDVYKLGKTQHTDGRRFQGYAKGSEIIISILVADANISEAELLKTFRKKFTARKDVGAETFEGNRRAMIDEILKCIPTMHQAKNPREGESPELSVLTDAELNKMISYDERCPLENIHNRVSHHFVNIIWKVNKSLTLKPTQDIMPFGAVTEVKNGIHIVNINPLADYALHVVGTEARRKRMSTEDYLTCIEVLEELCEMYPHVVEFTKYSDITKVSMLFNKIKMPHNYRENIKDCYDYKSPVAAHPPSKPFAPTFDSDIKIIMELSDLIAF